MTPLSNSTSRTDMSSSPLTRETMLVGGSNPGLRPAVYIKVIDLAKSYNIDTEKIKAEIEKINNAKCEAGSNTNTNTPSAAASTSAHKNMSPHQGKDDSQSLTSKVTEDSDVSGEKKHTIAGAGKSYPKRFSAMNGGFNLCLRVGKVEVVVDKLRVDKSRVRLAEVQVGDETGSISLRARDDQIDELERVSKEGGAIVLRNSSIELFQGRHLRLAVTKWGKISVYPDNIASTPSPPSNINTELNLSLVDLNLVPPDVWLQPPLASSTASHKSGESTSRQSMTTKQNQSNQHSHGHGHQQYRKKKSHHHDRRHQSQQMYMSGGNKASRMQDQNYNAMHGMSQQTMMANMNTFSPMYPGTQYYTSYEDAQMQAIHQRQRLEQQKQQNPQQQFLLMQQQHFQLQRQMEQMEQLLYNQRRGQHDQSSQSQTSTKFAESHSATGSTNTLRSGGATGAQMSLEQNLLHQPHMAIQTSSGTSHSQKTRREPWATPTNHNSPMTMEVPMSPQMNPLATTFAPHYSIPDLGTAMHHGQQQYYLQPQQEATSPYYTHPAAYAHSTNQSPGQDSDKHSSNKQQSSKDI